MQQQTVIDKKRYNNKAKVPMLFYLVRSEASIAPAGLVNFAPNGQQIVWKEKHGAIKCVFCMTAVNQVRETNRILTLEVNNF